VKLDVTEDTPTSKSEMLWETYSWLQDNLQFQYFLKIDHDSFLRLDLLAEELSKLPVKKLFWGGFVWKYDAIFLFFYFLCGKLFLSHIYSHSVFRQEIPVYAPDHSGYKLEHLPPYAGIILFALSVFFLLLNLLSLIQN
jgi:hypothetical protein